MTTATLVYINGLETGAARFLNKLGTLLTNSFSNIEPRGLGWEQFYADGYDHLYFSLGTSQSERIFLRLTASNDDLYIDRKICQQARAIDGYMLNPMGGTSAEKIIVGASQFEYWIVGNRDFIMLTTLVGSTYSHYYCGLINRFAPAQNSSLYGQVAPSPSNTTIPYPSIFTIGASTTLFLRTGFDSYGGYGSNNQCFIPGQILYIIDQSIGTSTTNNQGVVMLNSADPIQNSINVSYISGAANFSSFSIISIDPQPITLNTNSTIVGNIFLMLDDFVGDIAPHFLAVDEFNDTFPSESIQAPDLRGIYITYPIRLSNTQEIRGTLYGLIATPVGPPGAQDIFQTFDGLYKFINFSDNNGNNALAIGSVI